MLENISAAYLRQNITYMWYNDAQREPTTGINTRGDWIISDAFALSVETSAS
jgi:hypothetical protein